MSYENSYRKFYVEAWKENIYGSKGNNLVLNVSDELYWVTYANALQAFELAYKLAKEGFSLEESKKIYLARLEQKPTWDDK